MATFSQLGSIATSDDFRKRVEYAMGVAAAAVYAENPATTGHAARAAFANKVANGTFDRGASALMVLTNSTIANGATVGVNGNTIADNDIQFAVNSLWNVMAGA